MHVRILMAVLTAFASQSLSSALPTQSDMPALFPSYQNCDPSNPPEWRQMCLLNAPSVPLEAATKAIRAACKVAQDCWMHSPVHTPGLGSHPIDPWFEAPIISNGDGFRAFIRLDTKCGEALPWFWNQTSCMKRFHEIDQACGEAYDWDNFYFGAAKSQCDKTTIYFEPHTLPLPSPHDAQKQGETAQLEPESISKHFSHSVSPLPSQDGKKDVNLAPQCAWTLTCDLSDDKAIEIEGARTAINNACQIAKSCSNQTFSHPVVGQGLHGEEATLTLGSSCGFNQKSQMTYDNCQSKFWDINRNCGGLRDGRKFYLGNSTSGCDGTTIKIKHHHGCDYCQRPKPGAESCC